MTRHLAPFMPEPTMSRLGDHVPLPVLCRHAGDRLRFGGAPVEGELFHMAAERIEALAAALGAIRAEALAVDPFSPEADDVGDYD